jgi:hypothetical protein
MITWKFWPEKRFSDVYENIYIRTFVEDWFHIVEVMARELAGKEKLLDVGCGEGHTTKQILDRLNEPYICDLLEPNQQTLATAQGVLSIENHIGELYPKTLREFVPHKKYEAIFTSHTNYYWGANEDDYNIQLQKLIDSVAENGKLLILTLPEQSDHYKVMLRSIYPSFDYAEYIEDFYKKTGFKVRVENLRMRFYVGDFFITKGLYNTKVFYCFIHAQDIYPSDDEAKEFLKRISQYQKDGYIDFKDRLIVVEK